MHREPEKSVSTSSEGPSLFAFLFRRTFTLALKRAQGRPRRRPFLGVRFPVGGAPLMEYAVVVHMPKCAPESINAVRPLP
jgi:hypothetical protein